MCRNREWGFCEGEENLGSTGPTAESGRILGVQPVQTRGRNGGLNPPKLYTSERGTLKNSWLFSLTERGELSNFAEKSTFGSELSHALALWSLLQAQCPGALVVQVVKWV